MLHANLNIWLWISFHFVFHLAWTSILSDGFRHKVSYSSSFPDLSLSLDCVKDYVCFLSISKVPIVVWMDRRPIRRVFLHQAQSSWCWLWIHSWSLFTHVPDKKTCLFIFAHVATFLHCKTQNNINIRLHITLQIIVNILTLINMPRHCKR